MSYPSPGRKPAGRQVGRPTELMQGIGRACGAHQAIGLLEDVTVLGLLPRKEAEQHEGGAKQQTDQHDLAVGLLVGGVKCRGHFQAIQLDAGSAI